MLVKWILTGFSQSSLGLIFLPHYVTRNLNRSRFLLYGYSCQSSKSKTVLFTSLYFRPIVFEVYSITGTQNMSQHTMPTSFLCKWPQSFLVSQMTGCLQTRSVWHLPMWIIKREVKMDIGQVLPRSEAYPRSIKPSLTEQHAVCQ